MNPMANEPENLVFELLRGMRADITSVTWRSFAVRW